MSSDDVTLPEIDPAVWGDLEGRDRPFHPDNACCNAPCPPGAFCNTVCCKKRTKYYVQKWTCVWTKAWRCNFYEVQRCDVLKSFCQRRPQRCPDQACPYTGECDCFVPNDTYFAQVFEIEYEPCIPDEELIQPGEAGYDACRPRNKQGEPGGCACCGLYEVCVPRWVKIACKSQIPPEFPYEVPLPYYERERPERRCGGAPRACAGATCPVGPNANRSPDFWLQPSLPFA